MTSRPARRLKRLVRGDFQVSRGFPFPFGATPYSNGVNFSVFTKHAAEVTLVLFLAGEDEPVLELPLDPRCQRTGDIWHVLVRGIDTTIEYGYRMNRPPNGDPLHRYDPRRLLLDPFAKAIAGGAWGRASISRRSLVVRDDEFDWEFDQPLNIPLADSVIYETHVRGFTQHPSSGVELPGTFAGLIEKIPYLKELGVTAVELLPVNEFEEADTDRVDPVTGEKLLNFWGYQPISFFAPNSAYAASGLNGAQVREFKQLVKSMHAAGIEVILDVVFNHTAEGDDRGPTHSFRGIDNATYYMLDRRTGQYLNYSGCGNTMNCNHPVVREMIRHCLRYWVTEMHIDGFRFDLASILGRGQDGSVLASPPLLESLAHDPILSNTKLIAEAWDAAGLYQVGTFPAWSRWAEWNGKFRDDIRRFVRGDNGMVRTLAARLMGSPDLYQTSSREPYHSINFVTCHDGFTLADLVSYNRKHNERNGEDNRDGADENFSWNCGEEGPAPSPPIAALRRRQRRNLAALLLVSHGVPMILAGDELGRSQQGNNNAYCQDNEIGWINWSPEARDEGMLRFFRLLIAFRRSNALLRRATFAHNGEIHIDWHGVETGWPDWSHNSHSLAMQLSGPGLGEIYVVANAYWEPLKFALPKPTEAARWMRFVDTTYESPDDVLEEKDLRPLPDPLHYRVGPRSVVILVAR